MELYEYARPDLMAGEKLLYLHGFASSGQNGTVRTLKTLLPETEVIAPDIPVDPKEAMDMLRELCAKESPDLIVGTSMGAMYGEQLQGIRKILVNPAFQLADTILKNNGLGKQDFHSPRKDGATSFLVNKALLEEYRECSSHCFEHSAEDGALVYGLFGTRDNLVHTFDLFSSHYRNAVRFDGEHYMNDSTVLHSVLPIIQRQDDAAQGRSRKTVFISITDTLAESGEDRPLAQREPGAGALKAFRKLSEAYECRILESVPYNTPAEWPAVVEWAEKHMGVHAWDRVTISPRKDLIFGDYLIDGRAEENGTQDFMGTVLEFGKEPFKSWDEVLTYFDRLGGQ